MYHIILYHNTLHYAHTHTHTHTYTNIVYIYTNQVGSKGDTGEEDRDVVCTDIPISLKCPFTLKKISCPARGAHCEHFTCFDLLVFLEFVQQVHI